MNTKTAISTLRRDLVLGRLLHKLLLVIAGVAFGFAIVSQESWPTLLALGCVAAWLALTLWSLGSGRLTAQTAQLLAAGKHQEAEENVTAAIRRFGVLRPLKLATLHQLAVLRHAQGRHAEAVAAGAAFLRQDAASSMRSTTELLVAEAALEVGDLPAAHRAIESLRSKPLGLDHFAAVLLLQLDYQSRLELWDVMVRNEQAKLDLLDIRGGKDAALGSALLALARHRLGDTSRAATLWERACLLVDPEVFLDRRPQFRDILAAKGATSSDSSASPAAELTSDDSSTSALRERGLEP